MPLIDVGATAIGITWSPHTRHFIAEYPKYFDFVEIAFEQLHYGTEVDDFPVPIVLHCASLSLAGFVDPSPALINSVSDCISDTSTPWIGEHLAFLSGQSLNGEEILSSNFTLAPQLSAQTVQRVAHNWNLLQSQFDVPMILENPPQYFKMPGSTLTMADFMTEVCAACQCGMLLDLAHLLISARNLGHDPFYLLQRIPWNQVVELHIADGRVYDGIVWDNHAGNPDEIIWEMLEFSLEHCQPWAITLEFNWLIDYRSDFFTSKVERIRKIMATQIETQCHAS